MKPGRRRGGKTLSKTLNPRTNIPAPATIRKSKSPKTMPTPDLAAVKPKRPTPLAAVTNHESPPAAVGEINPRDAELSPHAVEDDPRPRVAALYFLLGNQAGDSHRRKIVNENTSRQHAPENNQTQPDLTRCLCILRGEDVNCFWRKRARKEPPGLVLFEEGDGGVTRFLPQERCGLSVETCAY